jgi:hypothetical protein
MQSKSKRRRKARITDFRRAGTHHAVLTVQGGNSGYRTSPCPTCPWRKDAVGIFPAQAFRHSAHTAYDMAQETFACHAVGCQKPKTCAGFLLRGSQHNLSVRLMLSRGEIDLDTVSDGGIELFDSYADMAIANGVGKNDPILKPCRGEPHD